MINGPWGVVHRLFPDNVFERFHCFWLQFRAICLQGEILSNGVSHVALTGSVKEMEQDGPELRSSRVCSENLEDTWEAMLLLTQNTLHILLSVWAPSLLSMRAYWAGSLRGTSDCQELLISCICVIFFLPCLNLVCIWPVECASWEQYPSGVNKDSVLLFKKK